MKKAIESKLVPAPIGPYSQAIEVDGMLYCSGQIALDPKSGEAFTGDVREQTRRVLENIKAVLAAADLEFVHVVKTTIFLTTMSDFAAVNEVYAKYFSAPFPARSTVAVLGLPKGVNIEIEVLARRGS